MNMEKRYGIIVALDLTSREKAMMVALEIQDLVDAIKVGYPLVLSSGISVVRDLSKISPVICDFKIADIPNTNSIIARLAKENRASGIIVHGFTGEDSIRAVVEAFSPGDVFSVVEMTHPGALEFIQPISMEIARKSYNSGVRGFIVPGTRPERIALYRKNFPGMLLLAPGIGAQGGEAKRAFENGADYIIVGRSIYESENPRREVENIIDSIQ
jgi:orotidine-5'-phosphate decarboxylase